MYFVFYAGTQGPATSPNPACRDWSPDFGVTHAECPGGLRPCPAVRIPALPCQNPSAEFRQGVADGGAIVRGIAYTSFRFRKGTAYCVGLGRAKFTSFGVAGTRQPFPQSDSALSSS
jgi:hypothetical protein